MLVNLSQILSTKQIRKDKKNSGLSQKVKIIASVDGQCLLG